MPYACEGLNALNLIRVEKGERRQKQAHRGVWHRLQDTLLAKLWKEHVGQTQSPVNQKAQLRVNLRGGIDMPHGDLDQQHQSTVGGRPLLSVGIQEKAIASFD